MTDTLEAEPEAQTAPSIPAPRAKPAGKIGVMIATPKRAYRGIEDLPPAIGRALRDLVERGAWDWRSDPGMEIADYKFREQADQYVFEFAAAVGGLSRARNSCVGEFLKTNDQFLIWNDDDLDRADGYAGLAEVWLRLLSHRQPVVGGLYCTRKRRPAWAATWMPAAEIQPDANGLLQVAELAMGCKLYHRKVYTETARIFGGPEKEKKGSIRYRDRDTGETLFGFHQNVVVEGDLLSEDYWMDYLCRCAKIPILADTKINLRHLDADGKTYPEGEFPPIPALEG